MLKNKAHINFRYPKIGTERMQHKNAANVVRHWKGTKHTGGTKSKKEKWTNLGTTIL